MTGIQTLEARAALGCIVSAVGFIAASSAAIHRPAQPAFNRAINVAFILSRLAIYIGVFFVLHLPVRGDIPSFYVPEAHDILQHMLPYRDFASSYAPLHTFLDAAVLSIWNSPLAIILLAIIADCFILPVWMLAARRFVSERSVRIAAVLYATSAVGLQFVAIDGQDNVIIAVLLGLGVLALARNRDAVSGALTAFGSVLIKFLALLFAPAFILAARSWLRWLIGFVAVIAVGYGSFAAMHLQILSPLSREADLHTASDLPYLLESITGYSASTRAENGLLAIVLLIVIAVMVRARWTAKSALPLLRVAVFGCASLNLALLIFSKKSWPPYLVLTLFPLCLLVSEGRRLRLRLFCFVLFNVVAVTTHSIWATIFGQFLATPFHHALLAHQPMAFVFLFTQFLLVAGYAWLLVESIDAMLTPSSPPTATEPLTAPS